jgi:hypothetical protein
LRYRRTYDGHDDHALGAHRLGDGGADLVRERDFVSG